MPSSRHLPSSSSDPKRLRLRSAAWNAANGFNAPVIVQYWHYLTGVLHGNLGYSYKLNQSVAALFGERWARSAYLSGVGPGARGPDRDPARHLSRRSSGTASGTTWRPALAFTAYAMPDFLLYLIAIQVFALTFPYLRLRGQPVQLGRLDRR
jgi:peptide/nickel transport system permease protein